MSADLLKMLLHILAGGFLIFFAITVARDNLANRLNHVTAAMLFFAGLGPTFAGLQAVIAQSEVSRIAFEESTYYNLRSVWEFFFPCLLLFTWIFPEDRLASFKHQRLRYIIFLPQLAHVFLLVLHNTALRFLALFKADPSAEGLSTLILKPISEIASWLQLFLNTIRSNEQVVFGIINLMYVLAAVYFLESRRLRIINPNLSTQTQRIAWALRVGLGLYVLAFLGGLLLPGTITPLVSSYVILIGLLTGSAIMVYAAVRYQFLDLRMIFRQSVASTIVSAALVGGYVVLVLNAETVLTPMFADNAKVVSYGFIIVILLFFYPISTWIDHLIKFMFIRTHADPRTALQTFSRKVTTIFEPLKLCRVIEETMKTALLVERVCIVIFDDTVKEYAVMPSDDSPRRIVIEENDAVLCRINLHDKPTPYHQTIRAFREGSRLAQVLEERRAELIVPFKDEERPENNLLGFIALSNKAAGYRYSPEDLNLLEVLSNQMVSALTTARLYVDSMERLRLKEEISMAKKIQEGLLPAAPPQSDHYALHARSKASRIVGGDFYDFIELPENRLGIVIADASGKGMPAALTIVQIRAFIRSEVNSGSPIDVMLRNLNEFVWSSTSAETYVTVFYGELDAEHGEFRYANAGHNYPIIVRREGRVELLLDGGPAVGAFSGGQYQASSIALDPDDVLFLFTDGLSEAMNEHEQEYGEERVRGFVRAKRCLGPTELIDSIMADARSHDPTEPPRDDTTIVALKISGKTPQKTEYAESAQELR